MDKKYILPAWNTLMSFMVFSQHGLINFYPFAFYYHFSCWRLDAYMAKHFRIMCYNIIISPMVFKYQQLTNDNTLNGNIKVYVIDY